MISFTEFNNIIGPKSKIWLYQFNKLLPKASMSNIENKLEEFASKWESHGTKLEAKAFILEHHFIIIAVNEASFEASGCSIDKSVQLLRSINKEHDLDLFNRLKIAVVKNEHVVFFTKAALQQELITGKLSFEDFYFDLSITSGKEINSILKPLHQSWFYQSIVNA